MSAGRPPGGPPGELDRGRPAGRAGSGPGRGRCPALALAGALTLGGLAMGTAGWAAAGAAAAARYRELRAVVDRNTGRAHLTRGVNMYTLVALRSCVTGADAGVMGAMLEDRDPVIRRAAAGVLADLGDAGRQTLADALQRITDPRTREIVGEALEAIRRRDPPLADYPLTPAERRRIRGCGPPR